jgi:hypothetical protein
VKHDRISLDDACTRDDKRRESVTLLCEVRQGTRPWQTARMDDISRTGFRIAWLPGAAPEQPLRIRIPGIRMLSAQIRWQQGKAVGCEFTEPLHIAVFEHLIAQLR